MKWELAGDRLTTSMDFPWFLFRNRAVDRADRRRSRIENRIFPPTVGPKSQIRKGKGWGRLLKGPTDTKSPRCHTGHCPSIGEAVGCRAKLALNLSGHKKHQGWRHQGSALVFSGQ
ncbi:hypothetical protein CDAR_217471 [Caerostris darwini]|uniref:Uncharacterized protein n=1 Tax=Caerostris darwini TaxID=1538125 RepID=A0AAV4SH67_9ARAC|nr:hypothetical protein CDAR_217471 [Caerostris darwini]